MDMNDILLADALDSKVLLSSESFIDKCCTHNINFGQTYDKNIYHDPAIPSRHSIIICCMDVRLDIFLMLGLKPGDAHIIRNGKQRKYNENLFMINIFP